jgi:spoIIIJ-associated protein
MTGFFGRIFGAKKKEEKNGTPVGLVQDLLSQLIQYSHLDLTFDASLDHENSEIRVEFAGPDEPMLREKEGQLLDALQLYVKRVLQHQLADERLDIQLDCNGFREETNQALIELADKLREMALSKGKSVYFRALPPKDRKVIHQYLADDSRVKSRSIGDGHYKKIKIYPTKEVIEVDEAPAAAT